MHLSRIVVKTGHLVMISSFLSALAISALAGTMIGKNCEVLHARSNPDQFALPDGLMGFLIAARCSKLGMVFPCSLGAWLGLSLIWRRIGLKDFLREDGKGVHNCLLTTSLLLYTVGLAYSLALGLTWTTPQRLLYLQDVLSAIALYRVSNEAAQVTYMAVFEGMALIFFPLAVLSAIFLTAESCRWSLRQLLLRLSSVALLCISPNALAMMTIYSPLGTIDECPSLEALPVGAVEMVHG